MTSHKMRGHKYQPKAARMGDMSRPDMPLLHPKKIADPTKKVRVVILTIFSTIIYLLI